MKRISILGSTGSIGKNCLEVARVLGREKVEVLALAANSNIELLEAQAKEFEPKLVALFDKEKAPLLQKKIPHIPVVAGMEGLHSVATFSSVNFVISSMSGAIGLAPTLAAISAKKDIGFANKEVLVSGGSHVMAEVKRHGVLFIPIDSELTAIFQCLCGKKSEAIQRVIITASGGPFRDFSQEELDAVTVDQALRHPNYRMGAKVTIDSSTLMNKGLEMIESHFLFDIPLDKIEILVHPEQAIHGMVEFVDNTVLAQISYTDMVVPIQYAISYPDRLFGKLPPFDFVKMKSMHFYPPDLSRFRCLALAKEAVRVGGSLPCYMNGANEVFVRAFLDKRIPWRAIAERLERAMSNHKLQKLTHVDEILEVDRQARLDASELVSIPID